MIDTIKYIQRFTLPMYFHNTNEPNIDYQLKTNIIITLWTPIVDILRNTELQIKDAIDCHHNYPIHTQSENE
uniref:Uncharacterized protein n=1 Tax=viral metagenome TaxID=1070528 RepID=A0A6M3KVU4_9ZZZZ